MNVKTADHACTISGLISLLSFAHFEADPEYIEGSQRGEGCSSLALKEGRHTQELLLHGLSEGGGCYNNNNNVDL